MGGDLHMPVHRQASPLKHQLVNASDPGVPASIAAQIDNTKEVRHVQIPSKAHGRPEARPGLALGGLGSGGAQANAIRLDPGSSRA